MWLCSEVERCVLAWRIVLEYSELEIGEVSGMVVEGADEGLGVRVLRDKGKGRLEEE